MTLINQTDSLSVSNDALVEVYKTMLDHQISNQNVTVTILLTITAIVLGAQWWFNKKGAKQIIDKEISSRMETELKTIESTISKLTEEKIKETSSEIRKLEGEVFRLLAVASENEKSYNQAVIWWGLCIKSGILSERPIQIRVGVDRLTECFKHQMDNFKKEELEDLKSAINIIPDHFYVEKEMLIFICNTFKTKD
jgi:hypothetical protein